MCPKKAGIYMLTNKVNGKRYVGETFEFYLRMHQHKYFKRKDTKPTCLIDKKIQQYGWENFKISIIEIIERNLNESSIDFKKRLINREKYFIEKYNTYVGNGKGYNINKEGVSSIDTLTEETKRSNTERLRKWCNENPHPMLGRKHSEETRKLISENLKGKLVGEKNPRYGDHSIDNYVHLATPVYQIDPKTDTIIKKWPSMRAASRGLSGHEKFDYKIKLVCTGEKYKSGNKMKVRKTTLGYKWKFVN